MARYRAGALDRRIVIRRKTVTYNSFNEPIEGWRTVFTVWANRSDASASEAYRAKEVGAEITTRFTVRWSSQTRSIDPKDVVRFGRRNYNIVAVRDLERNRWREIDAVSRSDILAGTTFDDTVVRFDSTILTWDES